MSNWKEATVWFNTATGELRYEGDELAVAGVLRQRRLMLDVLKPNLHTKVIRDARDEFAPVEQTSKRAPERRSWP